MLTIYYSLVVELAQSLLSSTSSTYDVPLLMQTDLIHPAIPRENVRSLAHNLQFMPALAVLCEAYSFNLLIPGVDEEL